MDAITIFSIAWIISPLFLLILWLRVRNAKKRSERRQAELVTALGKFKEKYEPITSIEEEVSTLRDTVLELEKQVAMTRDSYSEKRVALKKLEQQVAIYDEKLSFAELGVYEPHFDFGDAAEYKEEIKRIRDLQKAMVSSRSSTVCPTDWQVDGSRAKGQTMINRQTRLTMRAFNNECEAAIANTR